MYTSSSLTYYVSFTTYQTYLRLRTVKHITSANNKSLLDSIYTVISLYQSREFEVVQIRGDHQFECLRESLRPIHLHITAAGEHEVERSKQTLESDARTIFHSLPHRHYPKLLTRSLIKYVTHNRNIFPPSARL